MRQQKRSNNNKKRNNRDNKKAPGKTYSGSYRPHRKTGQHHRPSEMGKIYRRYDYLLEIYVAARRKYFEQFNRVEGNQKKKLENNYNAALKQLRDMERSISASQKAKLDRRNGTFAPDTSVSTSEPDKLLPPEQPPKENHHILDSQYQCDFSTDKEESNGTIEDYKALKGIS